MARENGYRTLNRTRIMNYLVDNRERAVTANEIHAYFEQQESPVNMTTIYRYLEKLCADGTVIKYVAAKGNMTTYQYVEGKPECHHHIHMKCIRCGKVIHLNCGFMQDFESHILEHHQFTIVYEDCVLMGICEKCR